MTPHHFLIKRAQFLKTTLKNGGGFTLIEILVYIAVLAMIILAVSSFFLWTNRLNTKGKAMREALDNARSAMEKMSYEIKEAKSIYTPTSVFSASSGQISLETKKYLPEGEIATFVDFYICENQLCFKKEGIDPIALTSDRVEIKNLELNLVATTSTLPSIQINLKVDYKNPKNRPELQASANLSSTVSLRSY